MTRSPCRWPISRRPTVNAHSPRRPVPASTPGQDVTSPVICSLAPICVWVIAFALRSGGLRPRLEAQVNLKSSAGCGVVSRTMPELMTIGEVARRSGVASSALRFYEEGGLIASARAGAGGAHRRYPRAVLRRVAFIVFARRVGLTLE